MIFGTQHPEGTWR